MIMNYLELNIKGEDNKFILARVMIVIHAFIQEKRNSNSSFNLGVSFPDWAQTETTHALIGNTIRLFASEEVLQEFLAQKPISQLLKIREVVAQEVKLVPAMHEYVRFCRERRPEKFSSSYQKRQQARDEKNGVELKFENRKINNYHPGNTYFLKFSSKSTKQERFSLMITKKSASKMAQRFSGYGLSSENAAGVPHF